jgi:hypothetical protein
LYGFLVNEEGSRLPSRRRRKQGIFNRDDGFSTNRLESVFFAIARIIASETTKVDASKKLAICHQTNPSQQRDNETVENVVILVYLTRIYSIISSRNGSGA